MFTCKDNATLPTPDCEHGLLERQLGEMLQSRAVQEELAAAGEGHPGVRVRRPAERWLPGRLQSVAGQLRQLESAFL